MKITRRPATDSDRDFAREAHHKAYRDVVTRRQMGKAFDK
jgi:hypothetical protein